MVQRNKRASTQALTLRIPEDEYHLLRALAFSSDATINQVVLDAIREHLDRGNLREVMESVLLTAKAIRGTSQLPRNPHGHGPKKSSGDS